MSSKKLLKLSDVDGYTVLNIGDMEIWDGADLALLRDTLTRLVTEKKCKALGVDLTCVKYIPSGFFGMLHDWHDSGVRVRLYHPQPNVVRMLWFSRFFPGIGSGVHELRPDSQPALCPAGVENHVASAPQHVEPRRWKDASQPAPGNLLPTLKN